MKKNYLLLIALFLSLMSFSQILDQSATAEIEPTLTINNTNPPGQLFIAGIEGKLTKFSIYITDNSGNYNYQLAVYSGAGDTGTLLGTELFSTTTSTPLGEFEISISANIEMIPGNTYTAYILPINFPKEYMSIGVSLTDSYPNGNLYLGNSTYNTTEWDMWFKTYVTPPTATHLDFDGVDDIIRLTNSFNASANYTIEAWIKTDTDGTIVYNASGYNNSSLALSNGKLQYSAHRHGYPGLAVTSNQVITDNNWHHVAVTMSAPATNNGLCSLYIDGVLDNSGALGDHSIAIEALAIGSYWSPYFTGSIDELRVWDVIRTEAEINNAKDNELACDLTGLLAYYQFNNGIGAGNNTSVATLTDITGNGHDSPLSNFALTGTSSNWLTGSPVTSLLSPPSADSPISYGQNVAATALTATPSANGSGVLWYTTATGGTSSTTAPTPSTTTIGATSYYVTTVNADGCESERTEIEVYVMPPATHLNFDGTDDYVNLPNLIAAGTSYTKQAMIRPHDISSNGGHNILSNGNEVFWIWDGSLRAGNTGSFENVQTDASSLVNTWSQVTVTYDAPSTTMKLFLNGNLVDENNSVSATVGGSIQLGAYGSSATFNGDIDEVRIWNKSLTEAEIKAYLDCEMKGDETGLTAHYKFNQGYHGISNTNVATLTDNAGSNHGTFSSGFALNGATSNFFAGSPITTGVTCVTLSASNFDVAAKLKMYPNPATSNVTINIGNLTGAKLQVLDITGKVLNNEALNSAVNSIDLAKYPSGVYIFKVVAKEGTAINKVIKQ
ncbi:LamG-like jellyroll fold domain-containing protein [Tamlana sp. 2_MG-2023]|uniref:LamG-like jellyroll fold domain-containing protein n=1 Tax=unclassified Tamlana TaxID=2614803 RepID=UPI0026E2B6E8|nr:MULTISPECIES: LamG-like jellyroll fold domain-containing protein [unclassified Tamlana]MDO6759963.1 LamG-like jellyroll fold domain-containing protein [Tamlana sp. 2_MG-2023]MDO6791867.1 LamG-like jellyroll fold domain-containing protein [Tamlana sp. 1_MG-2023]